MLSSNCRFENFETINCLAKFSENDAKVPPLKEVHEFCRGTYTLELFRKTEMLVLEMLEWDLKTITPYQFTQFYLAKGCAFASDNSMIRDIDAKLLRYLRKYAEFFVDLSLQDYEFIKYESHIVACASIAGARKAVGLLPVWNDELTELTETTFDELESCFEELYK
jgi:Cyclin, C-terminal domain